MNEKVRNIVVSVLLGIAVIVSWAKPLDTAATAQVEAGFHRSLISFGVARALNAAISVVQGTEISFQFGVGATFTPGEALDPVNDLVEQFGDLMLAASVAFGVMLILIKIGGFWFFSLLMTIAAGMWLALKWKNMDIPPWLPQALVVLLLVRFSVPLMMISSDLVFQHFLSEKYSASLNHIQADKNTVSEVASGFETGKSDNAQIPSEKESLAPMAEGNEDQVPVAEAEYTQTASEQAEEGAIGKFKKWGKKQLETASNGIGKLKEKSHAMAETLDPRKSIQKLEGAAENLVKNIVDQIVIFVIQTIVIPAVIMWILYMVGMSAIRSIKTRHMDVELRDL